jgi:hypothetical protein
MKKSGIILLSVIFAVVFLLVLVFSYISVFGGKVAVSQVLGALVLGFAGLIAMVAK